MGMGCTLTKIELGNNAFYEKEYTIFFQNSKVFFLKKCLFYANDVLYEICSDLLDDEIGSGLTESE